jgi:DNA-3-methyladenine glycosylase
LGGGENRVDARSGAESAPPHPLARSSSWGRILPASFYARPTEVVSRELLGAVMVSRIGGVLTAGRIVETEAYLGETDPACHAVVGRTKRTWHLFGRPGIAYVYFTYGMHWCTCAVTEREGWGSAVLIRALEPLVGHGHMRARRGRVAVRDELLMSGPSRLSQALALDGGADGMPLTRGDIVIRAGVPVDDARVAVTPRIGINPRNAALDWPLRWAERGSAWTSRRVR